MARAARGSSLRLVGTRARPRRTARRKPAAGQRVARAPAGHRGPSEQVLADPGAEGILEAWPPMRVPGRRASPAAGPRRASAREREALARGARCPVLLVRRGTSPSGLAPPEALTRFTWSRAGG